MAVRQTSACRSGRPNAETVLGSRVVTTYVDRGREYDVILRTATTSARPSRT
jgi:hypothetical protein